MNLDDLKNYSRLDTAHVAESLELLPDQVRQVVEDSMLIKVPREYSKSTEIVINGMGGSNIGVGIVKSIFGDKIKAPITITPGYNVPAHVGKDTLYIFSTYSGSTEEPLSVYEEVKKRGAKIMGITSKGNGKLEKLMLKDNIPGYIFEAKFNPCGQPRLGLGYSVFGIAALLAKAGMFEIKVNEIEDVIAEMEIRSRKLMPEARSNINAAKQIAVKLQNKIPVFIGAEFTTGNIRVIRNQMNENSKQFATYLNLPDLNHFAMEGLQFPGSNKGNLTFVFFDSKLYHPRIQKRSKLTKDIVKKNGVGVVAYELKGKTKVGQGFELLQLGAWITYYLGALNGVDPVKIPWVDWFKKQLK